MEQENKPLQAEAARKYKLYQRQKETLDIFLQRGAISKAQYDKSLGDLKAKMGIRDDAVPGR
jgi:hypothetical protein